MIHFLTWIPLEYQQSLCRELHEYYGSDFTVWFAERAHEEFPFRINVVAEFPKRYLSETGYAEFVRALRADKEAVVILGGWRSPMTARTLIIATLLRVPFFIWADHPHPRARGFAVRTLRKIYLRSLNMVAAGFLAAGQPTLEHLISLGLSREKIMVFPYWTELPQCWTPPAGSQNEAAIERRPLKLITVGRLFPVKQFSVAIEALSRANSKAGHRLAELVVAGDGPERSSLEAFAAERKISDCVTFLGWLESDEIRREIEKADLLLITSIFEGYSVVVLEAMAAGRPVLASEGIVGAVDRDEGVGAVLFHRVGDANRLAEQITWFATDRKRLSDASVAARRTAEKWPPSRAVDILREALGRTRAGRRLIARREAKRSPEKLSLPNSTSIVQ